MDFYKGFHPRLTSGVSLEHDGHVCGSYPGETIQGLSLARAWWVCEGFAGILPFESFGLLSTEFPCL